MNEKQVFEIRRRRSRQEVEQLIAEYESSGLSRSEFCRERGLSLSSLSRYRKRRARQAPAGRNALPAVEVSGQAPAALAATGSAPAVVPSGGGGVRGGGGGE